MFGSYPRVLLNCLDMWTLVNALRADDDDERHSEVTVGVFSKVLD